MTRPKPLILVIDDDADIRRSLSGSSRWPATCVGMDPT